MKKLLDSIKPSKKNPLTYVILILLVIPATLPLIRGGFYEPHDLHHIADIFEMYSSFASGQFPPRFAPDFLYNYGYPLFNFYYLLPFYVGAFLFTLGFTLTASFKGVFLISILVSILGMYKFLRLNFSQWASLAGSVLFVYTPYRAVQVYVRGAMGEAFALAIFPWVLFLIFRIMHSKDFKILSIGSVVIFLFLIVHNYLWFLSLPAILLLIMIVVYLKPSRGKLSKGWQKRLTLSSLLGFGLSAYWLVPAILERKLIDRLTPFLLQDHFPFIKQLIIPSWGYGSSVWGPGDEISFQIGSINLVLTVLGVVFIWVNRKNINMKIKIAIWAIVGLLISVFMMNIRSMPVWNIVPFYNFIQFPWRLLFLTTLFSSVIAAFTVDSLRLKWSKTLSILIIIFSIITTAGYFKPSKIVNKVDNDYMSRMFASKRVGQDALEVSEEHRLWSEDYLLLPNWSDEKPTDLPEQHVELISGSGKLTEPEQISETHYKVEISAETSIDIGLNKLYFPGWTAYVDGEKYQTQPSKPIGSVKIVDVSRGDHVVEFKWKETNLRLISDLVSVFSLVMVILLFLRGNEIEKLKKIFG